MALVDCLPRGGPLGFDRIGRETFIMEYIEDLLCIQRECHADDERMALSTEFERFAAFARSIHVPSLPATGHAVAFWLLELLANGASLDAIAAAAHAIKHAHEVTRNYLDWTPIAAALDFAIEEIQF
jgi:hypothetical protein